MYVLCVVAALDRVDLLPNRLLTIWTGVDVVVGGFGTEGGPGQTAAAGEKTSTVRGLGGGIYKSHFLPENCQDDRRNDGVLPELSLDLSGDLKGGNLF